MKLIVRKAKSEDVAELVSILSEAVKYKIARGDMSWGKNEYTEDEVKGMMKSGDLHAAFLGQKIVGVFLLQWKDDIFWDNKDDQGGYIHQLAIKQNFHGQGLGKKLIDWASKEIARRGKKYIRLDCDDKNKGLCSYYENLGFKQVGIKSIPEKSDYTAALYQKAV